MSQEGSREEGDVRVEVKEEEEEGEEEEEEEWLRTFGQRIVKHPTG